MVTSLDNTVLLRQVATLPYSKRVALFSRIGFEHKDVPELTIFIDSLLEHPPPDAPVLEDGDCFSEILPPQTRNVSKHYHKVGAALFAASASKTHLSILKKELSSPSLFFKNLVIKEVVRQEKNDDALVEIIKVAVPKKKK
eukprot:323032_1